MAQRGVNKAIIVGNLGQDPDVRYTSSGKAVANLSIATSESWKDQSGQQQESTEWHRVVIFGKLAEIAGQYLSTGSQLYIEGKIKTRKWQDQSGQDKWTTEIHVDPFNGVMQMLGGGQQRGSQPLQQGNQGRQQNPNLNPDGTPRTPQQMQRGQGAPPSGSNTPEPDFDFDDDVPF